jgi:hypothetical protein
MIETCLITQVNKSFSILEEMNALTFIIEVDPGFCSSFRNKVFIPLEGSTSQIFKLFCLRFIH